MTTVVLQRKTTTVRVSPANGVVLRRGAQPIVRVASGDCTQARVILGRSSTAVVLERDTSPVVLRKQGLVVRLRQSVTSGSRIPSPSSVGQIMYSTDGVSYRPATPMVDGHGNVMTTLGGHIMIAEID